MRTSTEASPCKLCGHRMGSHNLLGCCCCGPCRCWSPEAALDTYIKTCELCGFPRQDSKDFTPGWIPKWVRGCRWCQEMGLEA